MKNKDDYLNIQCEDRFSEILRGVIGKIEGFSMSDEEKDMLIDECIFAVNYAKKHCHRTKRIDEYFSKIEDEIENPILRKKVSLPIVELKHAKDVCRLIRKKNDEFEMADAEMSEFRTDRRIEMKEAGEKERNGFYKDTRHLTPISLTQNPTGNYFIS